MVHLDEHSPRTAPGGAYNPSFLSIAEQIEDGAEMAWLSQVHISIPILILSPSSPLSLPPSFVPYFLLTLSLLPHPISGIAKQREELSVRSDGV